MAVLYCKLHYSEACVIMRLNWTISQQFFIMSFLGITQYSAGLMCLAQGHNMWPRGTQQIAPSGELPFWTI